MRELIYGLMVIFVICPTLQLSAQHEKVHVEKAPTWIVADSADYTNTFLDKDAEDGYIDLLHEEQISVEQQWMYHKTAIKILSEAGIQNSSQISEDYDPSYQQLVF